MAAGHHAVALTELKNTEALTDVNFCVFLILIRMQLHLSISCRENISTLQV